jgi:hypothetical protein
VANRSTQLWASQIRERLPRDRSHIVEQVPFPTYVSDNGNQTKVDFNDGQIAAFCGGMIEALPRIDSLSSTSGMAGASITIHGANFGTVGTVYFGSASATVNSWAANQISVTIPSGGNGNVIVTAGGVPTTGPKFTVN